MKVRKCFACGSAMKRNGKTDAGSQRWRRGSCGASSTHRNNTDSRDPALFLSWLMSKDVQADMPGGGRGFRRRTARFRAIWPMPEVVDEARRVVFADGMHLGRDAVVLIARGEEHVLSRHPARAETTRAWRAPLSRMAPPEVVVTDGGGGFASAVAAERPRTRVQRCVFHAFRQVGRCTTSRPKLQAGVELYELAGELMHLDEPRQALWRTERFTQRRGFRSDFLSERTVVDGRREHARERPGKARRGLVKLSNEAALLACLDPGLTAEGPLPRTGNRIEGGVDARLREALRCRRGTSPARRIKAVCWWCCTHAERPLEAAELLGVMPTDADMDLLYELYATNPRGSEAPSWGDGLVRRELHHQTPYPYAID